MKFVSENLPDGNRGEQAVWERLQEAFSGEEGVAYHRFPIYPRGESYGHEADVVLVLRSGDIFVIECKGCHIGQVNRIEGHRWHMQNWGRDTETPLRQARDQMFDLKNWFEARPGLEGALRFHHAVALPFVQRAEWEACGFDRAPGNEGVRVAEDLSPQALRAWVREVRASRSRAISERRWERVIDHIGHGPDTDSTPTTPLLYYYEGQMPSATVVRDLMDAEQPEFTYVTATAAVEARRANEGFVPSHQRGEDADGVPQPQLTFPKMMRHVMGAKLFTRVDERVLLWKAAQDVAATDESKRRRLKHDVFAWRDAIAWLEERGYDLRDGETPEDVAQHVVHPEVRDLLGELQHAYRKRQRQKNSRKAVFEVAARRFLEDGGFRPTDYVVLEGFSRFTPLQRLFIRQCRNLGARVIMLFPFRRRQRRAFQAVCSTFEPYRSSGDDNLKKLLTPLPSEGGTDLAHLQAHLFAGEEASVLPESERDRSATVTPHEHVNSEVAGTVSKIIQHVDAHERSPGEMVVVTCDPAAYVPLLLEEAERRGRARLFHIRPRKLLLTPVGRFALTLYRVWDEGTGRLDMTPDQFESLIASGWLTGPVQETSRAFEMVRAQVFGRCRTLDEWKDALRQLKELVRAEERPAASRLPAAGIDMPTLEGWEWAVETVAAICRNLFEGRAEYTVGQHIQRLLDELTQISERKRFENERRVIERIRDELIDLRDSESVEMETAEFGDVLNSLVREREPSGSEELDDDPTRISVTGPFGVDRAEKAVVFMIGMDGARMPGPPSSAWPMYTFEREKHYDQQRYLFLAGIRAAQQRLHLSYAKVAGARKKQPSAFFEEAARLLSIDFDPTVRVEAGNGEADAPAPRALGPIERTGGYTLDELAHFGLCPHRYKMERLDDDARRYEPMWQVRFLAQGHWVGHALRWAEAQAERPGDADAAKAYLLRAMEAVEQRVKRDLPGLRPLDWRAVRHKTAEKLRDIVHKDFPHEFQHGDAVVSDEHDFTIDVVDGDRHYRVEVTVPHAMQRGKYAYPILEEETSQEWLLPADEPAREPQDRRWATVGKSDNEIHRRDVEGVEVFSSKYDALQWWAWAKRTAFHRFTAEQDNPPPVYERDFEQLAGSEETPGHIAQLVAEIEKGRYPKHPGDHCNFCPLKGECLGLDP